MPNFESRLSPDTVARLTSRQGVEAANDDPRRFIVAQLAATSVARWAAIGAYAFRGGFTVETKNTVYRFEDGVFASRAHRSPKARTECPPSLVGTRLVGFLADEDGLWSFSPKFRAGSHAVLQRPGVDARDTVGPRSTDDAIAVDETRRPSFLLTSRTTRVTMDDPQPIPWVGRAIPAASGSFASHAAAARPRRVPPAPGSTTRIHASSPSSPGSPNSPPRSR